MPSPTKIVTLLTLLFNVSTLSAAPTAEAIENDGLILLSSTTLATGDELTVYGVSPSLESTLITRAIGAPACGSNGLTCSDDHRASNSACSSLISAINSSKGDDVAESPRSICLTQSGNRCCVSWSRAVGGLKKGFLVNGAQKTLNGCSWDGKVSGRSKDTLLASTCVNQCLSDRPNGCS